MIINTLGPTTTDCFNATKYVSAKFDAIILYNSFDSIIANINNLKGQYILLPVAFESSLKQYGWKDFNFEYHRMIEIVEVFHSFTKEMVLVENKKYKINKAIIQPATKFFMINYLNKEKIDIQIDFAPSKFQAKMKFQEDSYRFATVSKEALHESKDISICDSFLPEMIWCLYKVKG